MDLIASAVMSIAVLAVLLFAAVVIVAARPGSEQRPSGRLVGLTLSLSALTSVFSLGGGVIGLISVVAGESPLVSVPTRPFWPTVPPDLHIETQAHVTFGGFEQAHVWVSGLSTGTRWMLGLGALLGALPLAAAAGLLAIACFQLLRGALFARAVARATAAAGGIVLATGLVAQLVTNIGSAAAGREVLAIRSAGYPESAGYGPDVLDAIWPHPGALSSSIDFWPIGGGLALLALAVIFTHAARLQRETEGLV